MDFSRPDDGNDMKYIKKSFKQLRKSTISSKGIESYTSSIKKVGQGQDLVSTLKNPIPNEVPLTNSLDSTAKKKWSRIDTANDSKPKGKKSPTFTSPPKNRDTPSSPGAMNLKYIQMRKSQNNRILSHIRVVFAHKNSSLGDKKSSFLKVFTFGGSSANSPSKENGWNSKQRSGSKESLSKTQTPQVLSNTKNPSSKRFANILSLYDRNSAETLLSTGVNHIGNCYSRKQHPSKESIEVFSTTGKAGPSYLSRVKEILTARKSSMKMAQKDAKKSPRSQNAAALFSSLREEDLLRIYDMNPEKKDCGPSSGPMKLKGWATLVRQGTYMPSSPHNCTFTSGGERDEDPSQIDETPESDGFLRLSVGSPLLNDRFAHPHLGDIINRLRRTLNSRDDIIEHLESENQELRRQLEAKNSESDKMKRRMASLGIF